MRRFVFILCSVAVLVAAAAVAQPTLDSLWPNPDGTRWEFDYHVVQVFPEPVDATTSAFLALEGTIGTPGGTAQVLLAEHGDIPAAVATAPDLPFPLAMVWQGRPDLREAIVARYGQNRPQRSWNPDFLHGGYFLKTADDIEMWQPDFSHLTWIYVESDLTVGASFVLQLVPEFADDIFLHGTVAAIDATVSTPVSTFTDAVQMDYLVDLGWQDFVTEEGVLLGSIHGEYRGQVFYVPDVGPVAMHEESTPFAVVDCPDCPDYMHDYEGDTLLFQDLALTALPVGTQTASWSDVKSLFR